MSTGTISSKILKTVTLGSNAYAAQLTVMGSGAIVPKASGGSGVVGTSGSDTLTNYGSIIGAAGAKARNGHAGGFGVRLTGGGVIRNYGTISGGAGGAGTIRGGAGGVGVYLNGGTLINAGYISGRPGGMGAAVNGIAGAAVEFGAAAGTLVVEAGASFYGQVLGNGTNTALVLDSSASAGTLTGLGSQFTGFRTISEVAGANWTLAGANTISAGITLAVSGALSVASGTLANLGSIAGPITVASGGVLVNSTSIGGGANGVVVVGDGVVTNQSGATISGATNAVNVNGNGTVVFDPGAVFAGKVVATGTGGTLELATGASAGTLSGLGTSFAGFTAVNVDAGVDWYLSGANMLNAGSTLNVAGGVYTNGSLTVFGVIDNTGSILGNVTLLSNGVLLNEAGSLLNGEVTGNGVSVTNAGTINSSSYAIFLSGVVLTNQAGGLLTGQGERAVRVDTGTIINAGSINGSGDIGISSYGTLNITNQSGGVITGRFDAIRAGGTIDLSNTGLIGDNNYYQAIYFYHGGTITNQAGGSITGSVDIKNGVAAVSNFGTISGNLSLGTAGTVNNAGAILAGSYTTALSLTSGGSIANSGDISGRTGVYLKNGTVTNGGTITGTGGTAVQFGTLSGALVIDAGAVFNGAVQGNGKNDALILGSSASPGTLTGLGTQFTGFSSFSEAAGATWTLTGNNTVGSSGITLGAASGLDNTGTISGTILVVAAGATASNYGLISAGSGVGVSLTNGGHFFNGLETVATSASIIAGIGVLGSGQYTYTRNRGTITANVGIDLAGGGRGINGSVYVTNALIQAISVGLEAAALSSRLSNDGTILATGSTGIGVMLAAGGIFTNGVGHVASALVSGTQYGVAADGGKSQVINYGTISGTVGVILGANTTFGTLTNTGTIIGTGGTAVELIHGADTVAITPGAVFVGNVVGASAYDVLSLGSGATAGTLSGLGSQFTGFAAVNVAQGATWVLAGNAIGSSTITIGANALLDATGALSVSKVKFLGASTLQLNSPASASAVFSGFASGDQIDLLGKVATGISFSTATDVLTVRGAGGTLAALHFSSAYTGHSFQFASDGHAGTNITIS